MRPRAGRSASSPGRWWPERDGRALAIPLLSAQWSRKLAEGFPVAAARRHLEHEQLHRLLAVEPELTLDALWRWTDQKELVLRRRDGRDDVLPVQPLDAETLELDPRRPGDGAPPESVVAPVVEGLVGDYAAGPAQARAMALLAAGIREWCCPRLRQLKPGQVVWLVYGTRQMKARQSPTAGAGRPDLAGS